MITIGELHAGFAQRLREIIHAPICWIWVAVILAVQTLVALTGGTERQIAWFHQFGLSHSGIEHGKVWQILTYGFLHGDWWHVGMNSLFVLLIGSRIEIILGWKWMTLAMLCGIFMGGLSHLIIGASGNFLVGLSGGCMSLLLLLTTLSPQSRMILLPISAKNLGIGMMMAALILALMDPARALPGLSRVGRILVEQGFGNWFHISHACHFGGAVAGWLIGRWLLRPRITLGRLRRDRAQREAV